jgi:2-methylcitrate dehydratase PrpD
MKLANANAIRAGVIENLFTHLKDYCEEDCGMIASNSFNFPVVADDGEEGWVEIVVKVPKGAKDEEYDGYALREDFTKKTKEAAEKKAERARVAAEKKAKKEKKKVE